MACGTMSLAALEALIAGVKVRGGRAGERHPEGPIPINHGGTLAIGA